jgi:hypothetical protein
LAALRCLKKLCAMCGDNSHRKAQEVVKNSEAMPILMNLFLNSKSNLIKVEAANALAYICLENKEHIKLAIGDLNFNYLDLFELFNKLDTNQLKLSVVFF